MSLTSVYVVFEKTDTKHFFQRMIHPYINHCYIIIPSGENMVVYNKTLKDVEIYTINEINDILQGKIVVEVEPNESSSKLFMINSCVGYVKQFLGITNPFVWTPFQLMRYLNDGKRT